MKDTLYFKNHVTFGKVSTRSYFLYFRYINAFPPAASFMWKRLLSCFYIIFISKQWGLYITDHESESKTKVIFTINTFLKQAIVNSFFNWDSLNARLNGHYKLGNYKNKKSNMKNITRKLIRKNRKIRGTF